MILSNRFIEFGIGFSFLLLILGSCSPYPPADFYEADGIISIDAATIDGTVNWSEIQYINSRGKVSDIQEPDSSYSLDFTFYLTNPGPYSFWMLTTGRENSEGPVELDVTLQGPDGFLSDRFQLTLPDDNRLRWVALDDNGQNKMISLRQAGNYTVSLNSRGHEGIHVHKIQLSYNDYLQPIGLGLPASSTPEISAADLFREQPVMMPPDWVFGLIMGSEKTESATGEIVSPALPNDGIVPDAYWVHSSSVPGHEQWVAQLESEGIIPGFVYPLNRGSGNNDTFHEQALVDFFERGYTFPVIRGEVTPGEVETAFEVQQNVFPGQERGIIFRDIHNAYNPVSKQYPALMAQPTAVEWDAAPYVRDNLFFPGGLSQLVETFTGPGLSTYNIPYLSIPVFVDGFEAPGPADEELLIRKLQLAAFMPVMQLLHSGPPSDFFYALSAQQLETLNRYARLRSELFPYIYSHAHFTRQTGRSLIEGFRGRENQFRFGDAFLVAPVTESGTRERSVFFPGEGNWYDYYSGRRYEAGQSWIVEAPLDRMPLFVKAGSVIPYRMEGGPVRKGTNDNLRVEIYTGDAGTFRLTEDDGHSRDYRRAIAARTMFRYNEVAGQLRLTIGAVQRHYEGMHDFRSYELHFKHTGRPQEVLVNDEILHEREHQAAEEGRDWYFDERTSTLIISLSGQWKYERIEIAVTP